MMIIERESEAVMTSETIALIAKCESAEEFETILADDILVCCMMVSKGRAFLAALEDLDSTLLPKNDRAIVRLRSYAVDSIWRWSSKRAMALDFAELVEDMEAVKQKGDVAALQYRAMLHKLVGDKLDMDRGWSILDAYQQRDADQKEELFKELREATMMGWDMGTERVNCRSELFRGDPLTIFKEHANVELEIDRFIGAPNSVE